MGAIGKGKKGGKCQKNGSKKLGKPIVGVSVIDGKVELQNLINYHLNKLT